MFLKKSNSINKNFLYSRYHSLRWKIKNVCLKMGENDFYPQLTIDKTILGSDLNRIKFWNSLAKKNPNFKYFYEKNSDKYIDDNLPIDKNNKYYNYFKEFYLNGITEIEDFFEYEDHKKILNFFEENTIKFLDKSEKKFCTSKDESINKLIHNKIKNFEKIIF